MKRYAKFGLPVLLLALAILLAACDGTSGGSNQSAGTGDTSTSPKEKTSRPTESTAATSGMGDMEGMDHGSGGKTSGMVMKNGKYSDERFIDAMVPHHEGAVEMAQVALKNAEHEKIKQLSRNIISSQKAVIKELKALKHGHEHGPDEEHGNDDEP